MKKIKKIDENWKEAETIFWKRFHRWYNYWIKWPMKQFIDWYFFDNSKSNGDKAMHIITWLMVNFTILRVLGFI